jgi:signal peptidase I
MAAATAAGVVVKDRYGGFCILEGSSMLPTIQAHGDVGLLDRRCVPGHDFSRGDVVVFRSVTCSPPPPVRPGFLGISSI